jgi:hypothetical protein
MEAFLFLKATWNNSSMRRFDLRCVYFGVNAKEKRSKFFTCYALYMVVEYSSTANTHPEGVRLVVLKTPPE